MHFGATLRLLRVHTGFTLRELADRIGVSNAYLSRVENGHDAPPTPDRLAPIARAFGLAPTTLIELADRIGPFTSDYLERVPIARELVLDLQRRELGPLEIARVRAFIQREFPAPVATGRATHAFVDMVDTSRFVLGLSCRDLDDVIDVAATKLARGARRNAALLADAIRAREELCSAALGGGLSVPHAVLEEVKPAAVVVTLTKEIDAEAPDGLPLRLFVVHVHRGGTAHARVLAEMARLGEPLVVAELCALRDPAEVLAELNSRAFGLSVRLRRNLTRR